MRRLVRLGGWDRVDLRQDHVIATLYVLGYRITDMSRDERWEVLTNDALSELGLREVAEIIARLCRERKRQGYGRERYAYAIAA